MQRCWQLGCHKLLIVGKSLCLLCFQTVSPGGASESYERSNDVFIVRLCCGFHYQAMILAARL